MERSVTIPLNEYENLRRRAEQAEAEFNAAVEKRVEEYRFNYKAKLQRLEEEYPNWQELEAYATWAYVRIYLLERAVKEAIWLGSAARDTMSRTPVKRDSEKAGEARAMTHAYRRHF